MIKFIKITLIVLISLLISVFALWISFTVATREVYLDADKLIKSEETITFYDDFGNEITSASLKRKAKSVELKKLDKNTINAFIASEDKSFYDHKGLNYKRILKALYKNIVSGSFKEGASTISQQLIKNTHLTGDKTIRRKLKEIRLTKQLEKKYGKDEILEMYLNTIYFGHNCYGLESAAEFYFDKNAEDLNVEESATLAGLLISPNNFSPFKHPEKCLKRRNIVLKAMKDCAFLSQKDYETALKSPIQVAEPSSHSDNSGYLSAVFDELDEKDINFYSLSEGCKIYTYLQPELQKTVENIENQCDGAYIITSKNGGVNAFKSSIGNSKRQPGSTVKPILVYGPAIEEKILYPFTQIDDAKTDYNGYCPENNDKKFHGKVTISECIKKSYNIPAVKTLNSLTLDKCEKYANSMNLHIADEDKNLALALGGMKYGLNLKELTDCYSVFNNNGYFSPSSFIKKITKNNGDVIYENTRKGKKVFSSGTCSLMNEMLIETAKTGTARKLNEFDYDVACKTGTCGNESGNTDAYAISYTSEHAIGVWQGDKNNKRLKVTGGNECCDCVKTILKTLYRNYVPKKLDTESGTKTVGIDLNDYENGKIILADEISPIANVKYVKVSDGAVPKEVSEKFSRPVISKPEISVENDRVKLRLCQTEYYSYIINRATNGKKTVIYDGKWPDTFIDKPTNGNYVYSVQPYYSYGKEKHFGEEIFLPPVFIGGSGSLQNDLPDIIHKDWLNL